MHAITISEKEATDWRVCGRAWRVEETLQLSYNLKKGKNWCLKYYESVYKERQLTFLPIRGPIMWDIERRTLPQPNTHIQQKKILCSVALKALGKYSASQGLAAQEFLSPALVHVCSACMTGWFASWERGWRFKHIHTQTEPQGHGSSLNQECQLYCAPGKLI